MPTPAAAMASAKARGTPDGSTVSRPFETTGATHVGFASQLRAVATTPEATATDAGLRAAAVIDGAAEKRRLSAMPARPPNTPPGGPVPPWRRGTLR